MSTATEDGHPLVSDAGSEDWLVVSALAPVTEGSLAPLYEAAAGATLAMPFCARCDQVLELEQDVCDRCESIDIAWRTVEPTGVVHSVTTVHRAEPGLIRHLDGPYHVVDAELDSGHRIVLTTDRPTTAPPRTGDPILIGFRTVGGTAVPAVAVSAATHPDDPEIRR